MRHAFSVECPRDWVDEATGYEDFEGGLQIWLKSASLNYNTIKLILGWKKPESTYVYNINFISHYYFSFILPTVSTERQKE